MIRALLLCAVTVSAAPRIASSTIDVSTADGHNYSIRMSILTTAEAWQAPSHTLERVAGARLGEIRATLDHVDLGIKLASSGAVDRVVLTQPLPPNAAYELDYSIAVDSQDAARIPIAVPAIPAAGATRSVEIHVSPPAGEVLTGDAFPVFERNRAGLANIPSHIEIETGARPRRSLPILMSDFGVVLLLAAGIAVRVLVRRRGAA